jgi:hypothetical protein
MQQLPRVTNGAMINSRHPRPIIKLPPITLQGILPLMLKQPIISNASPVTTSRTHATLFVTFTSHLQRDAQTTDPGIESTLNIAHQIKLCYNFNAQSLLSGIKPFLRLTFNGL